MEKQAIFLRCKLNTFCRKYFHSDANVKFSLNLGHVGKTKYWKKGFRNLASLVFYLSFFLDNPNRTK